MPPITTAQAMALLQQGRIDAAANLFGRVLRDAPNDALAHAGLGHCLIRLGRQDEAWRSLGTACRLSDRIGQAFSDLAWLAMKRGDTAVAIKSAEHALALNNNDANAQFIVGQLRFQQRRYHDAERAFARAAQLHPDFVEARYKLGDSLFDQSDFVAASRHYDAYTRLRPQDVQGWINLGLSLLRAGNPGHARAPLEKAVALAPDRPKPAVLLASALRESNAGAAELIPALRRAAALAADAADLHLQLAKALIAQSAYGEAKQVLRRVLELDPDNLPARWLLFQRPDCAVVPDQAARTDWLARWREGIEYFTAIDWTDPKFSVQANATIASTTNFYLAYLGEPLVAEQISNAQVLRELTLAASQGIGDVPARRIVNQRRKVAVFSPSLHEHSVSRVWAGAILALDPVEFELGVFHPGEAGADDASLARFRRHAARFESGARSANEWIAALRAFAPDIVIFLDIGMHQFVQGVASLRHAPVQASTWAHPVTSGMATIDYFLGAELFEPTDAQAHYSEKLVTLPRLGCSLDLPQTVERAPRPVGGPIRFLCTQSVAKLHPQHDDLFARVLAAAPTARLDVLCNAQAEVAAALAARMRRAFATHGVDFDARCAVYPSQPTGHYHRFLGEADACLDSLDFSGCITSLDALWRDLPIVTLPGKLMRGRQTYGMLQLLELDELIARDLDDYVRIATKLARDAAWRAVLVERIGARKTALYCDRGVVESLSLFLRTVEPPDARESQNSAAR